VVVSIHLGLVVIKLTIVKKKKNVMLFSRLLYNCDYMIVKINNFFFFFLQVLGQIFSATSSSCMAVVQQSTK
jgi:hypothetical protein